jgi:RNA polymerase sigma-70 factor, ECF subfamily
MMSLDEPDIEELVHDATVGDQAAREQLFAHYRPRLRRMIAVRMDPRRWPRIDPSHFLQEVWWEASQRLAERPPWDSTPFYLWLRGLAWQRLVAFDPPHVRARNGSPVGERLRLPDHSVELLVGQLVGPAAGANPSQQWLRAALAQLEPLDGEILVLRHLEQMPVTEIAAWLGLTEGEVKRRRLRAVNRLRAHQGEGQKD